MAQDDYLYQTVYKDPMQEYPDTDVSALRDVPTARDTTLFHKVSPGLTGISIDPYGSGGNYMTEWGRILTEGLDPIQKAQASTPVDTPVDTGGGGGAQIPGAVDTLVNVNTPFEQNLLDQGVGVQASPGDPVGAAFEEQLTQEAIDDLADYPVTPVGGQPIDPTGMLPQISTQPDLGEVTADDYGTPTVIAGTAPLEDAGAGIDDVYGTDYQGGEPLSLDQGVPVGEAYAPTDTINYSELDDLEADPGTQPVEGLTTEQSNTLQNIIGQAGQTVKGAMNQLSKIPGAVADFANQTVDIFGKKFNVGKTLLSAGINKLAGGPISLVFDALGALDLPGGPTLQTEKADSIGLLNPNATAGYQDKYGINTQSAFGDYDQYNIDRVEELETALEKAKGKYDTEQEYLDMTTRLRQELKDRKEYNKISGVGGDIDDDPTGDAQIAEDIALQDRIDAGIEAADEEPGAMIGDTQEIIPYGPVTQGNIIEEQIKSAQEEEMLAELAREEEERAARAREEAAQRAREEAAERAAAEQAEIDRQNRQREQEQQAAAQRAAEARAARERARRASEEAAARARARHHDDTSKGNGGGNQGTGAGAGGGSQQATSGGGFSSGWGGGWGWSKGGIVSLKNGKR